ncbi:hypothetical protein X777_11618 [Ooceraea biroi]|uniref:Uncharacterized protein n=1 Tax=Ooceraea biroi TaxID=2015173 RepID=A0A026W2C0_OOCBI|nr:hypothetical protein X777_11618 [Ooceraea biroi]
MNDGPSSVRVPRLNLIRALNLPGREHDGIPCRSRGLKREVGKSSDGTAVRTRPRLLPLLSTSPQGFCAPPRNVIFPPAASCRLPIFAEAIIARRSSDCPFGPSSVPVVVSLSLSSPLFHPRPTPPLFLATDRRSLVLHSLDHCDGRRWNGVKEVKKQDANGKRSSGSPVIPPFAFSFTSLAVRKEFARAGLIREPKSSGTSTLPYVSPFSALEAPRRPVAPAIYPLTDPSLSFFLFPRVHLRTPSCRVALFYSTVCTLTANYDVPREYNNSRGRPYLFPRNTTPRKSGRVAP